MTSLQCAGSTPNWRTLAFFAAWGGYSQSIYQVSWVHWLTQQRDPGFLAYCYVSQRWPEFDFGHTGMFDEETEALGRQQPWAVIPPPAAPAWVKRS